MQPSACLRTRSCSWRRSKSASCPSRSTRPNPSPRTSEGSTHLLVGGGGGGRNPEGFNVHSRGWQPTEPRRAVSGPEGAEPPVGTVPFDPFRVGTPGRRAPWVAATATHGYSLRSPPGCTGEAENLLPNGKTRLPNNVWETPNAVRESPNAVRESPNAVRESPNAVWESPFTRPDSPSGGPGDRGRERTGPAAPRAPRRKPNSVALCSAGRGHAAGWARAGCKRPRPAQNPLAAPTAKT
jgi:hypothetical protein